MWLIELLCLVAGGGFAAYVALRLAVWSIRWAKRRRGEAAELGLGVYAEELLEGFRGWLGDHVDRSFDDPAWQGGGDSHGGFHGVDGGGADHHGSCDGGDGGGMCGP
jgi:hypothetical protein